MDSFTNQSDFKHGALEVICGCMFSGKTEELIKLTKRAQFAHKKIQIFKPYLDNRYKLDFIVSHSNFKLPCEIVEDSHDIKKLLKADTDFVAIDEVQFFDQDVVKLASDLASEGRQVVCAGLDTDWQGQPFHPMPLLLASADIIRKQYAVCTKCGAPATRTQRTVPSEENILVGSGEVYQARCRMHFAPFQYLDKTKSLKENTL
jgi:thymidine kinase